MSDNDLLYLAAIVRHSEDAIISQTMEGIITSWNAGAEHIYGYISEEAIGRSVSMLVPIDRDDELPKILEDLTLGNGINHYDTLRLTKDQRPLNISLTISPIRDASGTIIGVSSIGRDVTKEKEAEAALRDSAKAYKLLMEQASDAILVSYDGQALLEVNQRASDLLGYTREELLQHTWEELFKPAEDGSIMPAGLSALSLHPDEVSEGNIVCAERLAHRSDGTVIVVEISTRQLDDERVMIIARNITDRKRAASALEESEARYRSLVETSPDAITLTNLDGKVVVCNHQAADLHGFTSVAEMIGRPASELIAPEDRQRATEDMLRVIELGIIRGLKYTSIRKDGSTFPSESNDSVILSQDGKPSGFISITRDVTEQRRTEEARTAQLAAEQANRAKSEFLSRMSHELRTPLNSILGFGQLLQLEKITPHQQESVAYILKGGHHLLDLINEVLDIARIEAGKLTISMEPVFLRDLLRESQKLVQPLATAKNIDLRVDLGLMSNSYVLADYHRLQQVLFNLLSNAIKYNRENGMVHILCSKVPDEAQAAQRPQEAQAPESEQSADRVRISVSDTGPGLSSKQLERLFIPFERLARGEQESIEGTGLGLAISKQLVKAMGGDIGVESEEGKGCTFWVEMTKADTKILSLDQRDGDPLPDVNEVERVRTVLYIEDNPSNIRLVDAILAMRTSIKVIPAMEGRVGLEMALERKPDLILLDVDLPDMTGTEVLRQLQANPGTASIPVIILSADANPETAKVLLSTGARAYVTKPINVKEFLRVMEEASECALYQTEAM